MHSRKGYRQGSIHPSANHHHPPNNHMNCGHKIFPSSLLKDKVMEVSQTDLDKDADKYNESKHLMRSRIPVLWYHQTHISDHSNDTEYL